MRVPVAVRPFVFLFVAAGILFCHSAASSAPLPRKIAAFYHPDDIGHAGKDPRYTNIHGSAEMPLNYLGMDVVYFSLAAPLPSLDSLADYRGILVWVLKPGEFNDTLCAWLSAAMDRGLKVVVLGVMEMPYSKKISAQRKGLYDRLGIRALSVQGVDPSFFEASQKDPGMVEFERKLNLREIERLPMVQIFRTEQTRVYLEIRSRLKGDSEKTTPVFTTPRGGVALYPFTIYRNTEVRPEQKRWRLNPFRFFEEAFGLQGWPRPDATTLNGRRIYFSHIDGDGLFNVSETDNKSWSGKVFMDEIIRKHPDSPFTASLITGYYDMRIYQDPRAMELTREILGLPNVQPASHGYAHPLIWSKGTLSLDLPGYKFDPEKEIVSSSEYIDKTFLSGGKKVRLFQWTGDCVPGSAHIALAEGRGLLNLNGGDTRFDRQYPSFNYVAPVGRKAGGSRQIYSGSSNENVYTNLWHGPYHGYRAVIETFKNTESPFRLKPVNLYMHFYSAEKIASLKSLKEAYDWAFAQKLFPLTAEDYVQVARSFYEVQIEKLDGNSYQVSGGPRLKTVRFDGEKGEPDLARSAGVLGYKRERKSLYVFLDESQTHKIVFSAKPPRRPHVVESNFQVTEWKAEGKNLSFKKSGWWTGEMVLGGLEPGRKYELACGGLHKEVLADAGGGLDFRFDDSEKGGPAREVVLTAR